MRYVATFCDMLRHAASGTAARQRNAYEQTVNVYSHFPDNFFRIPTVLPLTAVRLSVRVNRPLHCASLQKPYSHRPVSHDLISSQLNRTELDV